MLYAELHRLYHLPLFDLLKNIFGFCLADAVSLLKAIHHIAVLVRQHGLKSG